MRDAEAGERAAAARARCPVDEQAKALRIGSPEEDVLRDG